MFPWSSFMSNGTEPWFGFNTLLDLVVTILSWDVVRGTLAFAAAASIVMYVMRRLKRIAGSG